MTSYKFNRSFKEDYKNGKLKEDQILEFIRKVFKQPEIKKTHPHNHPFDFETETHYWELKNRTCSKAKYDTTLIPKSKFDFGEKSGKYCVYLFNFTDGLYYCIQNDDLCYETKPFKRRARLDYSDKEKLYNFIFTEQLQRILV